MNDVDQFQQNALHIACASGFSDLIMYLINRGEIDYYAQDFNGNTCLHMGLFLIKLLSLNTLKSSLKIKSI